MIENFTDKTAIGKRLRRLSDLIDRDARRIYSELGVDFEQRWFGVVHLLSQNDALSVKDLSERLGITHASVSETRKSLKAAGYILSQPDPADGRQRLLSLSPSGRQLIETMSPVWQALEVSSAHLNEEAGDIVAALDRLSAALDQKSLYDRTRALME